MDAVAPQETLASPDAGRARAATVWRRIMGSVYESLLLFGPLLVVVFFYSILTGFGAENDTTAQTGKRIGLQLAVVGSLLAYFAWGWSKGRCTLPMQTLGLRLLMRDGRPVSPARAFVRAAIAGPAMFSGVGVIWALLDKDAQSIHDRLTGTRLVQIPVNKII
jgi:uncharacterized RDD family membrane protein YckC